MGKGLWIITGLILLTCSPSFAQTNDLTGNCSPKNLVQCTTKELCEASLGVWCLTTGNQGKCNQAPYTCICTLETPIYCRTQTECEKTTNYWCPSAASTQSSCINTPCNCVSMQGTCCNDNCNGTITQASDCTNCCIGDCLTNETICINAGGYYCDNTCKSTPCLKKCIESQGTCCENTCTTTTIQASDCTNCCIGTCESIESCTNQETCTKSGGYWCNNQCINTPCTSCTLDPSYCTTKEECINAKWNYCYYNNNYYCTNQTCPQACTSANTNDCNTEQSCKEKGGYWCNNKCVNEQCPITCTQENGVCCAANQKCSGTYGKTSDCANCCIEGKCIEDTTCEGNNNCKTKPDLCSCPKGYDCNPENTQSLTNGCLQIEYKSTQTCRSGDNCLTNPACACNTGNKCDPKNENANDKGCINTINCTNCCGDNVCAKGECNSCPNDCSFQDCKDNQECNIKIGENCANTIDCTCNENNECNPKSEYANIKGCAPINKSICGNGIIEEGENSINCCIDAGCTNGECLPRNKMKINITFSKVYANPKEYTCALTYCGNGITEEGENSINCCIDAGCTNGECVKNDIDKFKCIIKTECGNGITEENENSINCCIDTGCPQGLTCTNNACIKEATNQEANTCASDNDCLCFNGCGALNKNYALTNPSCTQNITCANKLPKCNQGKCVIELESINDNQVIKYLSIINELRYRLEGMEPKILKLIEFLNKAFNYYNNNGDTNTSNQFALIANDTLEVYKEYISLINDTKNSIEQPSIETINYLSNKIEVVNTKLITIMNRINRIEINGVSVQELITGEAK